MYLVSTDGLSMINLESVTCIYVGADGITLKANFSGDKGCQIGRYQSEEECRKVIEMIGNVMGKADVYFLPSTEDVRTKIQETKERWHHATGKKTKGHGGS